MNHWKLIAWFAPRFAEKHLEEAQHRQDELDKIRRAQNLIARKQEANADRIAAIETELRLLGRGKLR